MRKILIHMILAAAIGLVGCSSKRFSLVHHVEVQQGNVVTQEMVDKLSPGMNKRQVQIVMGTPTIVDVFHQDRWDYPYRLTPSDGKKVKRNISLFFENDRLMRITGDIKSPGTGDTGEYAEQNVSVTVPYQDRGRSGVLTRLWRFLTFRNREEPEP